MDSDIQCQGKKGTRRSEIEIVVAAIRPRQVKLSLLPLLSFSHPSIFPQLRSFEVRMHFFYLEKKPLSCLFLLLLPSPSIHRARNCARVRSSSKVKRGYFCSYSVFLLGRKKRRRRRRNKLADEKYGKLPESLKVIKKQKKRASRFSCIPLSTRETLGQFSKGSYVLRRRIISRK